jgi:hypothetical protein
MATALQTVTPQHQDFRQFTIHIPYYLTLPGAGANVRQWLDLDRLLVQFWKSHSLRPKVVWISRERECDPTDRLGSLLPGITERGILDLVEHAPMEVR